MSSWCRSCWRGSRRCRSCSCQESADYYNCRENRNGRGEFGGSADFLICTADGCTYKNICTIACCNFIGCPISK